MRMTVRRRPLVAVSSCPLTAAAASDATAEAHRQQRRRRRLLLTTGVARAAAAASAVGRCGGGGGLGTGSGRGHGAPFSSDLSFKASIVNDDISNISHSLGPFYLTNDSLGGLPIEILTGTDAYNHSSDSFKPWVSGEKRWA